MVTFLQKYDNIETKLYNQYQLSAIKLVMVVNYFITNYNNFKLR